MKKLFLIYLFLAPTILIGQKKKLINFKPELWTFTGILPLERGAAIYNKTQFHIFETVGINLNLGYGIANPRTKDDHLSNIHAQSSFIAPGLVYKTRDIKRGKSRNLNFLMTVSIVLGQGKEGANYHFKGNDYNDYTSREIFKQKFYFNCSQLTLSATYRIKERLNVELGSYFITNGKRNFKGVKHFELNRNYAYAYNGIIGFNLGVGYLLLKPNSNKNK